MKRSPLKIMHRLQPEDLFDKELQRYAKIELPSGMLLSLNFT